MKRTLAAMLWIAAAAAAGAQQVNGVAVGNTPEADAPQDEGGKAVDVGGLASRGGSGLNARHSFQSTIGTSIYSPIRTPIYTPVQQAAASDRPQD